MHVFGHLSAQFCMSLLANISCFGLCNTEQSIAGKEVWGAGRSMRNSSVLPFPSNSNNNISMYIHIFIKAVNL